MTEHSTYVRAQVTCENCGFSFTTRSTKPEIRVTVCSHCHPYFTGKGGVRTTNTQIERFNKRYAR